MQLLPLLYNFGILNILHNLTAEDIISNKAPGNLYIVLFNLDISKNPSLGFQCKTFISPLMMGFRAFTKDKNTTAKISLYQIFILRLLSYFLYKFLKMSDDYEDEFEDYFSHSDMSGFS